MASRIPPLPKQKENKELDIIDKQLLIAKSYTFNDDVKFGCEFIIDGVVFKEHIKVNSIFRGFKVYTKCQKMGDYADMSGLSLEDDTNLQLSIQYVPNGVIINSNVYLSHNQWNTLYAVSEENRRCAVCNLACDVTEHVASSIHMANMDRYKPVNKYDLSITRKINNNYHCGVCNALFDQRAKDEHFSSKEHEDKQLFAINKVSDIMYDVNIHANNNNIEDKKDSYHFNAKAINNNNLDVTSSEDEYEYEDDYVDKWNQFNGLNFQEDYNEDDYYYEEPPQNLANSYASMARKPKADDLPEILEIDLGNKKATVKFDSWNMVNRTKRRNLFYCMACKMYEHVRLKAEHCRGEAHINRLKDIPVVDTYENYLVRQVNDKLYHCGHCNNLQLIHEMEDHIESEHPNAPTHLFETPAKKLSTPVKTNPAKNNQNNDTAKTNEANKVVINDVAKNDTAVVNFAYNDVTHTQNDVTHNGVAHNDVVTTNHVRNDKLNSPLNSYITKLHNEAGMFDGLRSANTNFDDIIICAYGSKIRISKIAFNIVCQGEHDFYCGLCEVNISMDILKLHLNDLQHLTLLHRTPFIEAFNVHLFREIRDALHCALCNELIQIVPDMILKHKILEKHIVKYGRSVTHEIVASEVKPAANNAVNNAVSNNAKPIAADAKQTANNNINGATNAVKTANNVIAETKKDTVKTANNVVAETKKDAPIANKNVVPNINNINGATNAAKTNNVVTSAKKDKPVPSKNVALNNIPQPKHEVINNKNKATNGIHAENTPALPIVRNAEEFVFLNDDIVENARIPAAEFVVVKNGLKEDIPDDLDESFTDDFDYEEYIYVKLGNSYIKITNAAFNTLVNVGDGGRYCFVCSSVVDTALTSHVESRGHTESMEKFKFVDKYNEDLLRQFYLMYHCGICNAVVSRKQLSHHLTWPTHVLQRDNTKLSAKKRKSEIKNGTKQITVQIEKENIYLNEKESDIKIYRSIAIEKGALEVERKNKIVIFNDNVLKVGFDCWHSLSEAGEGYRCKMCQCDLEEKELGTHVTSEWHRVLLDKIEKQYAPALIRKISDTTLNCIMCNSEIANNKNVTEHIHGKKHVRHYEAMLKESSVTNSYADCDQDVLMV